MSLLPWPVKRLTKEDDVDARLQRTWVRLERTRRAPRPVRPGFVVGAVLAAGLVAVVAWPRAERTPAPAVVVAPLPSSPRVADERVNVPHGVPAPTAPVASAPATVVWRGRPTPGVPRPSLVLRLPGASVEAEDPVDALLASADEAWQAGDTARTAVLLSELAAHHPEDARAGSALYLLGQIQLEVLERPDAAVASFERAIALGVPDELLAPLWAAHERASDALER